MGDNMTKIYRIFYETFKSTAQTILKLAKIMIPVIFIVTLIKMTGILEVIAGLFEPAMKIFNLPGEATLPLILGAVVNLYAAISAIETLDLTPNQITTISIMLLIAHSLLVETAVIASLGVKKITQLSIRIGIAIVVGIIISIILGGIYG